MATCEVCGTSEFVLVSGFYCCRECGTQSQGAIYELSESESVHSTSRRSVSSLDSGKKVKDKSKLYAPWVSVEAFNIIIYKQVKALINIGSSPKLKDVVQYIWATYVQKCELAFINDYSTGDQLFYLGVFPTDRDVQLLCNGRKINRNCGKKKNPKKGSKTKEPIAHCNAPTDDSMECSDAVADDPIESCNEITDDDAEAPGYSMKSVSLENASSSIAKKLREKIGEKKLDSTKRNYLVQEMHINKTLCFCYLGLLYAKEQMTLSDLIRFVKEGKVPYMNAPECLPSTMKLQVDDRKYLTPGSLPQMKNVAQMSAKIINFLQLPKLKNPLLLPLTCRFIKDLNLPYGLIPLVKNLINEVNLYGTWYDHTECKKYTTLPLYDAHAMAFIIVAFKTLFILDGETERKHSKISRKINSKQSEIRLFIWEEWVEQSKLKEHMLLYNESEKINLSLVDQLNVDKLANYFSETLLNKKEISAKDRRSIKSRKDINAMFSNLVFKKSLEPNKCSSFPLHYKVKDFISHFQTLPAYKESCEFDFTFLKKDFSLDSVEYILQSENCKSEELQQLYQELYSLISVNVHKEKRKKRILKSKYWFEKCSVENVAIVLNKLPESFKWLLNFLSTNINCTSANLYIEVVRIETELFSKLNVK